LLGNVGSRTDLLAKLNGRRKEEYGREWVKHGWSNNGRWGRGRRGKGRGSASTPHEVPSNFSAVSAPTLQVCANGSAQCSISANLAHVLISSV